jgi:hypothetical protein
MDLWRHLFAPDDIIRVGHICHAACEATAAEWCWGNTWAGAVIQRTVAMCWPASALLRNATRQIGAGSEGKSDCDVRASKQILSISPRSSKYNRKANGPEGV